MSRFFHSMGRPLIERVSRFDDWFCQRHISDDHLAPQAERLSESSFYLAPGKLLLGEEHLVDEAYDIEPLFRNVTEKIRIYLDKKENGIFFSLLINLTDRKYHLVNIPDAEAAKEKLELVCGYRLPKAVMQSILKEVDFIKKKYIDVSHDEVPRSDSPTHYMPTRFS